jgi:hypothetical protein
MDTRTVPRSKTKQKNDTQTDRSIFKKENKTTKENDTIILYNK